MWEKIHVLISCWIRLFAPLLLFIFKWFGGLDEMNSMVLGIWMLDTQLMLFGSLGGPGRCGVAGGNVSLEWAFRFTSFLLSSVLSVSGLWLEIWALSCFWTLIPLRLQARNKPSFYKFPCSWCIITTETWWIQMVIVFVLFCRIEWRVYLFFCIHH